MRLWNGFESLFTVFRDWIVDLEPQLPSLIPRNPIESRSPSASLGKLQTLCLVVAQEFASLATSSSPESDSDVDLQAGSELFESVHRCLRLERMVMEINDIFAMIQTQPSIQTITTVATTLPYLDHMTRFVEHVFASHTQWIRGLLKQTYVLMSILQDLATRGFCQPQEESSEKGGSTEEASKESGTGFGEGDGGDYVDDGSIDQEQVEGLQAEGETEPNDLPDSAAGGEAGSADNMNDAQSETVEREPDEGSENGQDEADGSVDEKVDDLDLDDPNVLDEKVWGNENPEDTKESTTDRDGKPQQQKGEMSSRDDSTKPQQETSDNQDDPDNPDTTEEVASDGADVEEPPQPGESGAAIELPPEAEILDLPDDLSMGDGDDLASEIPGQSDDESNGDEVEGETIPEADQEHPMDADVQPSESIVDQQSGDQDTEKNMKSSMPNEVGESGQGEDAGEAKHTASSSEQEGQESQIK
jgi:midasin